MDTGRKDHTYRFQPTPPHGERLLMALVTLFFPLSFNPRPRTGSDSETVEEVLALIDFQPTPPHGERPVPVELICTRVFFQPTPPHGERQTQ